MTAIDTLDGIEDGTDVAVVTLTGVQRWKVQDGGLARDGTRLDPWFFIGYLNEGHVMLGNFAPPEVGEWFTRGRDGRGHLVIEVQDDRTTAVCARFLDNGDRYYDFVTLQNVVENYQRTDRPGWITQEYVNMSARAWTYQQEALRNRDKLTRWRNARNNLTVARDYLNAALEITQ